MNGRGRQFRPAAPLARISHGCAGRSALLVFLIFCTARTALAKARVQVRQEPTAAAVQQLRAAGLAELQSGEFATAARSLESAYRLLPEPQGLYLLARLALAQGRIQAAKDLARRYLAEAADLPGPGAAKIPLSPESEPARTDAQRILALPMEPAGEATILGPPGAWVILDDRLAGSLPLSRPLWLCAGPHQVTVQDDAEQRVFATRVDVSAGRMLELRLQRETGAVLITRVPSVLLLWKKSYLPQGLESQFLELFATAARREHLAPATAETSVDKDPLLAGCPESMACLEALAERHEAAYILSLRISHPALEGQDAATAGSVALRLFSSATGELVTTRELPCPGCSAERMLMLLSPVLAEVLAVGGTRPRGELLLQTEPPGAEVLSDGHRLGTTPYRRAAWTGSKRIELRRSGFLPWSAEVRIDEGKQTTRSIVLAPEPSANPAAAAPAPAQTPVPGVIAEPAHGIFAPVARKDVDLRRRPRWRIVAGALSAGAAVILAGFGAAALAENGSCSPDTPSTALACRSTYESAPIGGALLGVGGALLIAGAALALPPGPRLKKPQPPPRLP